MMEAVEVKPLVCEAMSCNFGQEMRYIAFMERFRGSIDETAT